MPPKAKTPAPIDRPLSKAYLREFGGWSTEYPPGISDPSTLRVMENVLINGDGSARVRPGLKYAMPRTGPQSHGAVWDRPLHPAYRIISKLEQFYEAGGRLSYLFAVSSVSRPPMTSTPGVTFYVWRTATALLGEQVVPLHLVTSVPAGTGFTTATTYVKFLQLDNKIVALSNAGEDSWLFNVGVSPISAKRIQELPKPDFGVGIVNPSVEWITTNQDTPGANMPLDRIANPASTQLFPVTESTWTNLLMFSTFSHEMGESSPSHMTQNRIKRDVSNWDPRPPGNDSWDVGALPKYARDQLGLQLWINGPESYRITVATQLKEAYDKGATHWNIYAATWSHQGVAPVEAPLIASVDMRTPEIASFDPSSPDADDDSLAAMASIWAMWHYDSADPTRTHLVPSAATETNYSTPSAAANGIVAGDRMILVRDAKRPAEIWWTSNQPGKFTRLDPNSGGGRKTLTSGNLYLPSSVVLWQNPQSADTITILCSGADGLSTAYYMAPASVSSQSDNTIVMAFEETTATQGTVSPYGVIVLNNALYHPLDDQLQKSTASNYNINHRGMTELIAGEWSGLVDKELIEVAALGNHLYFLVHNPNGEWINTDPHASLLHAGFRGNEVWVLDTGSEGGTWSRWLTPGVTLQTLFRDGELRMALVRPEGVFYFDSDSAEDEILTRSASNVGWDIAADNVPWKLETNIQGANRAHDAWVRLQQVSMTFGNIEGTIEYGIRGQGLHGRMVERSKIYRAETGVYSGIPPFEVEDHLLVREDLKEWVLFARSLPGEESFGQINLVQYRYAPISVNVGYEYGSPETFEYGRDEYFWNPSSTVAGVPREGVRSDGIPQ